MARKKPNAKKGKPNPNPAPAAASNIAGAGSSTQAAEPEVVREEPPLLQLAIVASPAFWAAAGAEACPAQLEELADGKAAAPSSSCGAGLPAVSVPKLLTWFAEGTKEDPCAKLCFAASLSKEERAAVHKSIEAAGLSAVLESASEGVGEERALSVFRKGAAPAKPVLPEHVVRANLLYRWAKDADVLGSMSRDEIAEQVARGSLAAPLAALWEAKGAGSEGVRALMAAIAAAGDGHGEAGCTALAGVEALLAADASLANAFDDETGQPPLHAAARAGAAGAVRALVAAGARLEDKDARGRTALQISRTFENCDVEAVLLQAGAFDPEADLFPLDAPPISIATSVDDVAAQGPGLEEAAPEAAPASPAPAPEAASTFMGGMSVGMGASIAAVAAVGMATCMAAVAQNGLGTAAACVAAAATVAAAVVSDLEPHPEDEAEEQRALQAQKSAETLPAASPPPSPKPDEQAAEPLAPAVVAAEGTAPAPAPAAVEHPVAAPAPPPQAERGAQPSAAAAPEQPAPAPAATAPAAAPVPHQEAAAAAAAAPPPPPPPAAKAPSEAVEAVRPGTPDKVAEAPAPPVLPAGPAAPAAGTGSTPAGPEAPQPTPAPDPRPPQSSVSPVGKAAAWATSAYRALEQAQDIAAKGPGWLAALPARDQVAIFAGAAALATTVVIGLSALRALGRRH